MLKSAIESLIHLRTGGSFSYEVLVIDDGSTDETPSVVHSIIDRGAPTIRYIRQQNKGVAAARNTGIRHARGKWIAFFDDDELAEPDWLAELISAGESAGADCVGGPCLLVLPEENLAPPSQTIRRLLGENPVMRRNANWKCDPRFQHSAIPGTGNALVRKELFDRIGLFSELRGFGEDYQFFRRAQAIGAQFAIAPGAIIHHVMPANRLTPDYLLALAAKGGASQGEIDVEVNGTAHAVWNAVLRSAHLVLWTLPCLLLASVIGDDRRALSKRCSVRFCFSYLVASACRCWAAS